MTPTSAAEPVANSDLQELRTGPWIVIIPVKPADIGKSRLSDAGGDRMALARAIALDTIAAASAATQVARVLVVTDDPDVSAAPGPMRAVAVLDRKSDVSGKSVSVRVTFGRRRNIKT